MSSPAQRYDSLWQVYAEWALDKTGTWSKRATPIDWQFLKAQGVAESDLNPNAESPVGAEGLTQFMQATWDSWAAQKFTGTPPPNRHITPFDPEDAIWAQADMMGWLLGKYGGNKRKALAAYNWGCGNIDRTIGSLGDAWEQALPAETRGYLWKVLGG